MKRQFLLPVLLLLIIAGSLLGAEKSHPGFRSLISKPSILLKPVIESRNTPVGVSKAVFTKRDSIIGATLLDNFEDVAVIVQFNSNPVIVSSSYGEKLANRVFTQKKYQLAQEHARFRTDIARFDSHSMKKGNILSTSHPQIVYDYTEVLNGVSLKTKRWMLDSIADLPYVKSADIDGSVHAVDDASNVMIGADSCWSNTGAKGDSIVIGILDTGIDYFHESLGGSAFPNNKVIGGYDVVNGDNDPMDDNGHGTHVAGIVAGDGPPPVHLQGVAPHAKLMAFKVLDEHGNGSYSQVIAGLEKALDPDGDPSTDDGVNIINLSLGGTGDPNSPLSQAVNNVVKSGVLCVVAAGNSGPGYLTIASPGDASLALTVGAASDLQDVAEFSSRGPSPKMFDIKPEIVAPGVNINSAKVGGGYVTHSGTSMATPHATGAAALLLQIHRSWTPDQIKAVLIESATDEGTDVWTQGKGCINPYRASEMTSMVLPGTVNFGIDDLNQGTWSVAETLWVCNHANQPETYSLSGSFGQTGINVEFNPGVVTLQPGERGISVATLHVQNDLVPFRSTPPCYSGTILVKPGNSGESITVVSAFTKAVQLDLQFDAAPWFVAIHNNANVYFFLPFPGKHVTINPPAGVYDIMVRYTGASREIVREQVPINESASITISRAEASHQVFVSTLDAQSQPMPFDNFGLTFLTNTRSGYGISTSGTISDSTDYSKLYFSDVTSAYRFDLKTSAFSAATHGNYYEFPFSIGGGIWGSRTLKNDPSTFKCVEYTYTHAATTDQICFVPYFYRPPSFTGPGFRYNTVFPFSQSPYVVRAPFNLRAYYLPNPEPDFEVNYSYQDAFDVTGGVANEIYKSVQVLPLQPDTIMFGDHARPVLSSTAPVLGHILGNGVPCWNGSIEFSNSTAVLSSTNYFNRGLFISTGGDLDNSELLCAVQSLGKEKVAGSIFNSLGDDSQIQIPLAPGLATLAIVDTSYAIAGVQGNSTVRFTINTLASDPNPPFIKMLRAGNPQSSNNFIDSNVPISLSAEVGDYVGIKTVQFFYRRLEDSTWVELDSKVSSETIVSQIPALASAGLYSVRVFATDVSGNSSECSVEPMFGIRGVQFLPSSLVQAGVSQALPAADSIVLKGIGLAGKTDVALSSDNSNIQVSPPTVLLEDGACQKISIALNAKVSGQHFGHVTTTINEGEVVDTLVVSYNIEQFPRAPQLLQISPDSVGYLLTWKSTDSAAQYRIQIAKDSEFSNTVIDEAGITQSRYAFAIQDTLGRLFSRIRSENSNWTSPWSDVLAFSPIQITYSLKLSEGWNLFSIPINTDPKSTDSILACLASQTFKFDKRYVKTSSLNIGVGYWVKAQLDRIVPVKGICQSPGIIQVKAGWNLVGSPGFDKIAVASLVMRGTRILSKIYKYDSGYSAADSLEPGRAYWVKADSDGTISTGNSMALGKSDQHASALSYPSTITITDRSNRRQILYINKGIGEGELAQFELPPLPPNGIFDARFGSGSSMFVVDSLGPNGVPILMQSALFPVSVEWHDVDDSLNLLLESESGNVPLAGSGKTTLSSSNILIRFGKGGADVRTPKQYRLYQNYPNPFDPTTTIQVEIPAATHVSLRLYDAIGKEVATLVDRVLQEGRYSIPFDGSKFSSGTYFYCLNAGNFKESRKCLLVK